MFTSAQVIAVAFLDILGIFLNVWFLYTVKVRPSPFNAIDVLQALKTTLVVLALVLSVWLDVLMCSEGGSETLILLCIGSKASLENLLFHSICSTFLSVACVRRKVCKCRGRAAVLVTTKYAIKTLLLTFTPVGMFVAATISLISSYSNYAVTLAPLDNTTSDSMAFTDEHNTINDIILSKHSRIVYQVCHTTLLNVIPIISSLVIYIDIINIVRHTAKNSDGYVSNRNKTPTKLIILSVVILLACTCSLWTVYASTIVLSVFIDIPRVVFVYLKLAILISHPFGEGLMLPSTRKPGDRLHRQIQERSTRQIYPELSQSMTSVNDCDGVRPLSALLPALIEEKETARQSSMMQKVQGGANVLETAPSVPKRRESIIYPRPSVLMKNAAFIGLEYREDPTIVALSKRRRDSEERLRNGLKNIQEEHHSLASCRKLSTSLRLSCFEDFPEEDMYNGYRQVCSSGKGKSNGQKKYNGSPSSLEEYKGLAYANSTHSDSGASGSGCLSPSQRRWKRLFTTARTARHFSQTKQSTPQPPIEEHISVDLGNKIRRRQYSQVARDLSSKQQVSEIDMYEVDSPSQYSKICSETDETSVRKGSNGSERLKKRRSISVTKNAWMRRNQGKQQSRERNRSVSFISNVVLDGNTQTGLGFPRSISCGTNVLVNYGKEEIGKASKSKRKIQRFRGERSTTGKWTVTSDTTREECIQNLLQLKDYF